MKEKNKDRELNFNTETLVEASPDLKSTEPGKMSRTHGYDGFVAVRNFSPSDSIPENNTGDLKSTKEHAVNDFSDLDSEFEPKPISPDDVNYEQIMEQFTTAPTKPKYWFEEFGDYWSCSCGHINRGDLCTNCGLSKDLLKTLFVLQRPGSTPPAGESMPLAEKKDPKKEKKGFSKTAKILSAILIFLLLVGVASLLSYVYVIKPSMEQTAAKEAKATGKCLSTNVVKCASGLDDFLRDSYIDAGDERMDGDHYTAAIRYYHMAEGIKESDELTSKINKAKYKYVKSNQSEGGETFEQYLGDLYEIDYPDVDKIYDKYYAWKINIVTNLSKDDYSTDIDKASREDTVYFHVSASGGPPDKTLDLYYEATWPSGKKATDTLGEDWTSGSKNTVRFLYQIPLLGKEGTFTFKVYNSDTQELMGTDTITFEK